MKVCTSTSKTLSDDKKSHIGAYCGPDKRKACGGEMVMSFLADVVPRSLLLKEFRPIKSPKHRTSPFFPLLILRVSSPRPKSDRRLPSLDFLPKSLLAGEPLAAAIHQQPPASLNGPARPQSVHLRLRSTVGANIREQIRPAANHRCELL
ncbi:proline iminopeptidase [Striga asiatica]|uniref:Proline iminopeptidase n=1 Tax=Striga asiatica TaxID=4170 RepID=A0A5A7PE37_STRAF|nr:proline iminopeptidase [Striga asiatica]